MTQEEKQLLLKDLCGRLPYGVYVDAYSWQKDIPKLLIECVPEYVGEEIVVKGLAGRHSIKEIKPYLRPISSMTLVEKIELKAITKSAIQTIGLEDIVVTTDKGFDYLNAHYIDYRGLISMGLALEAPENMYDD